MEILHPDSDEGYLKFVAHWQRTAPLPWAGLADLDAQRNRLYAAGLVGAYPNGVGYGNLSCRAGGHTFYITGSATGRLPQLTAHHYSWVTEVDADANQLWCSGPVVASSESMTHAVFYRLLPWVGGVVHLHHLGWWEASLHHLPTTAAGVAYGTPAMAAEIARLLRDTNLAQGRLLAMAGHREGMFAFGESPEAATSLALRAWNAWRQGQV